MGTPVEPAPSGFPKIPAFQWLCDVPTWVDVVLSCFAFISLFAIAFANRARHIAFGPIPLGQIARITLLLSGVALVALDQQRFQPWWYQVLIFQIVFACSNNPRRTIRLLQPLIISVYCYSAFGKFDYQFLHTVGVDFVATVGDWFGNDFRVWEPSSQTAAVMLLPTAELLLGLGLLYRQTRPWAGWLACLFHVALMAVFSPLGLGHSNGVVLWNLQFAVQAVLLFVLPSWTKSETTVNPAAKLTTECTGEAKPQWRWWLAVACVTGAALLPLTERLGVWDHWPSWALYAPHSSRVRVWVARAALDRLPADLQQVIDEHEQRSRATVLSNESDAENGDNWLDAELRELWVQVPLNSWCLHSTGSPIYPQARVQLGVARQLAAAVESDFAIRAEMLSAASRFTGQRQAIELRNREAFARAGSRFWLSTDPRGGP